MEYDPKKWQAQSWAKRPRKRSRTLRWSLSVSTLLMACIGLIAAFGPETIKDFTLIILSYPLVFTLNYSPFARRSWAMALHGERLDEFELATERRATLISYWTLVLLVLLALIYLWIGSLADWPIP